MAVQDEEEEEKYQTGVGDGREEDERVRVASSMEAGSSHLQATSDPG